VNHAVLHVVQPEHIIVELCRSEELDRRRGLTSELDEMWSYVRCKANPRWLWHAIDHHTVHVLGDIVRALQYGDVAGLSAALEQAVIYLACHAQRAHPARDRQTGRSQLGLEPLYGSDDGIEMAEAA